MKFNLLRAMESDAQHHQNPIRLSHPSSYHLFSQQASTAGYTEDDNIGGSRVEQDMIRQRFKMREAIQREIEKERIREEIIAEETARKRVLEAEVRNELMVERKMAMRRCGGFGSRFMPIYSMHSSQKNSSEQIGLEEKLVMWIDEKYGRGGRVCEMRGGPVSQIRMLGDSPRITVMFPPMPHTEENRKEVIVLGKPDSETLSGTKRKSSPPVSEGSSQLSEVRSNKKVKEEWSCAICQVSTTSERSLTQHIQGKKHQVKEAALVAQKTGANFGLGVAPKIPLIKPVQLALTTVQTSSSETKKPSSSSDPNEVNKKDVVTAKNKDKFKFWCELCQVGAFSEAVMNDHKEGKKHSTRLVDFYRKGKVDSEASATENTCDSNDKTETKSNLEVVVATVAEEVKTVEDDMAYVATTAAEENNTTKTAG